MYTRSTPQRAQNAGGNQQQQQYQGQNQYKQDGNYQGNNQQNAYKQGQQGNNTPFKQQQQQQQPQTPQQQQTPQPQRVAPQVKQQQMQQMQQKMQQQQQQHQQQQQQQQQPPQQQTAQQQAQRLKPILKSAGPTPQAQNQQNQQNVQPQSNNGMDTTEPPSEHAEDGSDVPKWKRKVPGLKVNRKLKRLRLNQRLRKTLQPKNAIMVLNEMKTGVQFTFPESSSAISNSLFIVHAEIDGKTYIGQGISKPLARQNAAENALKSLLLEKMTAAAMKARLDAENETGSTLTADDMKDTDSNMETSEDGDDIPWSCLASFALYKLFLEWQNQGTVVPVPRPGVATGKVKKEPAAVKPLAPKELPPNALLVHPVMLLNQMRPGLAYNEVSRVGSPPNLTFTLSIDIDGQQYVGTAKNKKDAKKNTAKTALQALYGLIYPEEKEEDVVMS